jgi:hypothetical protein
METKAISMKATRYSLVRSKIVFNRRQLEIQKKERSTTQQTPVGMKTPSWPRATGACQSMGDRGWFTALAADSSGRTTEYIGYNKEHTVICNIVHQRTKYSSTSKDARILNFS